MLEIHKMSRKMTAGNSVMIGPTSIKDMTNLSHLSYDKPYSEFNYDLYANDFKQSNFVGGKRGKTKMNTKLNSHIKTMYDDYRGGAKSKLNQLNQLKKSSRKMKGGQEFPIELKDMKNVSNLDYQQQFSYNDILPVSRMPRSNMTLGE